MITATMNGELIAEFTFDCMPDLDGNILSVTLHGATVYESYRNQGIGTEIIRRVKEIYPNIIARNTVNSIVDDKNDIHYSDKGHDFIMSCIEKGLIQDPQNE